MDTVAQGCLRCHGEVMAERVPLTGEVRDRCLRCGHTRAHRAMRIGDAGQTLALVRAAERAPRHAVLPDPMGFTDEALAELRRMRGAGPAMPPVPTEELPGVATVRATRRRPGLRGPRQHGRGHLQQAIIAALPTRADDAVAQGPLLQALMPLFAHSRVPQRLLCVTLIRLTKMGAVQRVAIGGTVRKRWAYWRAA